jgi:TonB family protein
MKLTLASIILTGLLFSPKPIANEVSDFNTVYKAYNQALESGDKEQTLELAKQAVSLGESTFIDDRENLHNLKLNLAAAYIDVKEHEQAAKTYEALREEIERRDGKVSQDYLTVTLDLLELYSRNDWPRQKREYRDNRAESIASHVISLTKKLAKKTPETATSNFYIASKVLYNSKGIPKNYVSVVKLTEKARNMLVNDFGENDLKTIETRYRLGRLNMRKGRYKKAIENFEEVVATIEAEYDTSHPYEVASHAALIEVYENLGKSDESTKHCIAIGQITPWEDDAEPTPLYRVNPRYPIEYARRGKQGYTKIRFDISASGFVKNIEVIESNGKSFNESSITALEKWRYAPKFENGKAVATTGIEVQLDYQLRGS